MSDNNSAKKESVHSEVILKQNKSFSISLIKETNPKEIVPSITIRTKNINTNKK